MTFGWNRLLIQTTALMGVKAAILIASLQPFLPARAEPIIHQKHSFERAIWVKAGFQNPDIKTIRFTSITKQDVENGQLFTHELTPTLVLFRHSGWSEGQVGRALEKTAKIYMQCGIKIEFAKLIQVDPPFNLKTVKIDQPYTGLDLKIATRIPLVEKPVFFFVRSADNGYTAWATPRFHTPAGPFQNTMWITSTILKKEYWPDFRDKSYSVEAHELAHLLGNRNHVRDDVKNILGSSMGTGNDQITAEQCEAFRNSDLVRPLQESLTLEEIYEMGFGTKIPALPTLDGSS